LRNNPEYAMPKAQDYALPGLIRPGSHVTWESLTENLHFTMPKACRECVRWLRHKDKKVVWFPFWLAAPGRALALDPDIYWRRIESILASGQREQKERLQKVFFRGKWDGNSEIITPDPVAAYVNGDTLSKGVWVWATRNRFELWAPWHYQKEVEGANRGERSASLPAVKRLFTA
jgi:DNA-binding transcriptional regulator/RsmH inhibitor MraZ